ncbi:hypothetical protein T2812B_01355 [Thermotoga sp. 2812B]|nr:hypothetical protein T2812B_01355 [Thermotoga sp. 2812B]EJX26891.1 hypothetical protein EMP_01422 [Thermotoga sp. EMP]
MQMKQVLLEARQDFLSLLKRRGWKEKDLNILRGIFLGELSRVDVPADIFELAVKEAVKGNLKLSSKLLGVSEIDALEILFWHLPKKYPFPSERLKKRLKARSVKEFIEEANRLRVKLGKKDFMELYLHLEEAEEEEEKRENVDLLERVRNLSIEKLSENDIEELKYFYSLLDLRGKESVRTLNVHPYILSAIIRNPSAPIVIDGSNLLWRGGLSISYIYEVFERLAVFREFFFPYRIVFDRNAEFVLPVHERKKFERWKNSPNVLFESPADGLIISLASTMNAVILSGDRFRDHGLPRRVRVLKPEEIEKG